MPGCKLFTCVTSCETISLLWSLVKSSLYVRRKLCSIYAIRLPRFRTLPSTYINCHCNSGLSVPNDLYTLYTEFYIPVHTTQGFPYIYIAYKKQIVALTFTSGGTHNFLVFVFFTEFSSSIFSLSFLKSSLSFLFSSRISLSISITSIYNITNAILTIVMGNKHSLASLVQPYN